ncbi:McrB family protein [Zhongshania guokunii]|uniref:McrB family protein n=1 Tax=Zhongshania guokunii TaxID=641783 RepID=A0ABV3U8Y7_9GAMM
MLKDLRIIVENKALIVNQESLGEIKIPTYLREELQNHILANKLKVNPYSSYANTSSTNFALFPNQMYRFAVELQDLAFELKKYFECIDRFRSSSDIMLLCDSNRQKIIDKVVDSQVFKEDFDADDYDLFAGFIQFSDQNSKNDELRLGGKSIFNVNGAKRTIRSNEDCFGSVLLTQINLPNSSSSIFGDLVYSLTENVELYDKLKGYFLSSYKNIGEKISLVGEVRLEKPFLLLAGISGTGKTRFVREQAKSSGQLSETYCLTSVRPDWHEPSDILGYISRLSNYGQAEYITTDVLQFIAKAWRGIADKGLAIEVQDCPRQGKRLVVSGDRTALTDVLPYWLCLDEMNLAPVEQYFADYLSVLETREWLWEEDTFIYFSDALLKPATINAVADKSKLRADLGFDSSDYDELWQLICGYGLAIPFNLMVAGTVNMDETTHGFSRKVIDRALSVDFGAFFPNSYDDFLSDPPAIVHKTLSYPIWSGARNSVVLLDATADVKGIKSIAFLTAVNTVLKNTPFELAFRALNELLLAVISSQPQNELTLKAVWDDFMMCKVLPRIEGDSDKLTTTTGENVLAELNKVLADQLSPIWNADKHNDQANQRPDLYREQSGAEDTAEEDKVLRIACRSKGKLAWMKQRLDSATFTSFWP